MAINLSVNLNKVCLLRNSRGGVNPAPIVAAAACIDAGVQGLTLHWREDERHTRAADVRAIAALCHERKVEFNLEGDTRPQLLDLAIEVRATQFTLVPVTPGEVTSDHGWDLPRQRGVLVPLIERAHRAGLRTAIFMDPDPALMAGARETGTQRVELYTEPYARAFGKPDGEAAFLALRDAAREATRLGLGVNAGHDLDLRNTPRLAREVPEMLEVSIGHALLADALYLGIGETIRRYLAACRGEAVDAPKTC